MILSSGLGIVLSLVFGLLFLALLAELYYLLWWKKLAINQTTSIQHSSPSHAKQIFYLFCWNKPQYPPSSSHNNINTNTNTSTNHLVSSDDETTSSDIEIGASKEFFRRAVGGDDGGVESDLMRLHNLSGPPRFLFTIKEETKEDLESEDRSRKGSRTKSLSDLILAVDNPFITTPLSSPPPPPPLKLTTIKTTNSNPLDSYSRHGFNPLFESVSVEAELDRLRSSPPPKFKFLRDAEEKLYRRILEEAEKINRKTTTNTLDGGGDIVVQQINSYPAASARTSVSSDEGETGRDGSNNLIKIVVGKSVTGNHSTSSQGPMQIQAQQIRYHCPSFPSPAGASPRIVLTVITPE